MKMRKAIYILSIAFLIFSFSNALADYKKFSFGPKVGYKYLFEKESNKATIDAYKLGYNLALGGEILYSFSKKNSIGLEFEYWKSPIYFDGITSIPEMGDKLKVYKTSVVYKFRIGTVDTRQPQVSLGGAFDYYYSKIVRYYTITGDDIYDQVRYKDVGVTLLAGARYRFLNLWSEISAIKLTGGKIIGDSFKWDYLGGVPNIDLHNVTGGVSLLFNF